MRTPSGPASEFWYEFLVNFFSTAFAQRNEPHDLSPLFHPRFRTAFSGIVTRNPQIFAKNSHEIRRIRHPIKPWRHSGGTTTGNLQLFQKIGFRFFLSQNCWRVGVDGHGIWAEPGPVPEPAQKSALGPALAQLKQPL